MQLISWLVSYFCMGSKTWSFILEKTQIKDVSQQDAKVSRKKKQQEDGENCTI
jgi:hypothetical protein